MKKYVLIVVAIILIAVVASLASCTVSYPNRNPIGETFPVVSGKSLHDDVVDLPAAVSGSPAILMVGYQQNTQFDLDRWTIGFTMADAKVRVVEVPVIPAWFPTMFLQGTIDNGMRGGIPQEDWGNVVTLYGSEAKKVAEFTGTANGRNGRILLLNDRGEVTWFWDEGFSASRLKELLEKASSTE
jgi:hypothetical protein